MHQRDRGPVQRVGQVGEERLELQRRQHPLVDDRPARQARQVQAELVVGPLAQAVRLAVKRQVRLPRQPGHDQLDKLRQHGTGLVPAMSPVVRHVAPAEDGQALGRGDPRHLGLHDSPVLASRQERQPRRIAPGRRKIKFTPGTEQLIRHLGQDAGAVAGLRIGALGPAVIQVAQHGQRTGDRVVTALAGQVSDKADATGVVLVLAVVQASAQRSGTGSQYLAAGRQMPSRALLSSRPPPSPMER